MFKLLKKRSGSFKIKTKDRENKTRNIILYYKMQNFKKIKKKKPEYHGQKNRKKNTPKE